jgi:hypothetical protein
MTDLEKFKKTLLGIKCNFSSVSTLVGFTVSVYSETSEMQFEFDRDGIFCRTI